MNSSFDIIDSSLECGTTFEFPNFQIPTPKELTSPEDHSEINIVLSYTEDTFGFNNNEDVLAENNIHVVLPKTTEAKKNNKLKRNCLNTSLESNKDSAQNENFDVNKKRKRTVKTIGKKKNCTISVNESEGYKSPQKKCRINDSSHANFDLKKKCSKKSLQPLSVHTKLNTRKESKNISELSISNISVKSHDLLPAHSDCEIRKKSDKALSNISVQIPLKKISGDSTSSAEEAINVVPGIPSSSNAYPEGTKSIGDMLTSNEVPLKIPRIAKNMAEARKIMKWKRLERKRRKKLLRAEALLSNTGATNECIGKQETDLENHICEITDCHNSGISTTNEVNQSLQSGLKFNFVNVNQINCSSKTKLLRVTPKYSYNLNYGGKLLELKVPVVKLSRIDAQIPNLKNTYSVKCSKQNVLGNKKFPPKNDTKKRGRGRPRIHPISISKPRKCPYVPQISKPKRSKIRVSHLAETEICTDKLLTIDSYNHDADEYLQGDCSGLNSSDYGDLIDFIANDSCHELNGIEQLKNIKDDGTISDLEPIPTVPIMDSKSDKSGLDSSLPLSGIQWPINLINQRFDKIIIRDKMPVSSINVAEKQRNAAQIPANLIANIKSALSNKANKTAEIQFDHINQTQLNSKMNITILASHHSPKKCLINNISKKKLKHNYIITKRSVKNQGQILPQPVQIVTKNVSPVTSDSAPKLVNASYINVVPSMQPFASSSSATKRKQGSNKNILIAASLPAASLSKSKLDKQKLNKTSLLFGKESEENGLNRVTVLKVIEPTCKGVPVIEEVPSEFIIDGGVDCISLTEAGSSNAIEALQSDESNEMFPESLVHSALSDGNENMQSFYTEIIEDHAGYELELNSSPSSVDLPIVSKIQCKKHTTIPKVVSSKKHLKSTNVKPSLWDTPLLLENQSFPFILIPPDSEINDKAIASSSTDMNSLKSIIQPIAANSSDIVGDKINEIRKTTKNLTFSKVLIVDTVHANDQTVTGPIRILNRSEYYQDGHPNKKETVKPWIRRRKNCRVHKPVTSVRRLKVLKAVKNLSKEKKKHHNMDSDVASYYTPVLNSNSSSEIRNRLIEDTINAVAKGLKFQTSETAPKLNWINRAASKSTKNVSVVDQVLNEINTPSSAEGNLDSRITATSNEKFVPVEKDQKVVVEAIDNVFGKTEHSHFDDISVDSGITPHLSDDCVAAIRHQKVVIEAAENVLKKTECSRMGITNIDLGVTSITDNKCISAVTHQKVVVEAIDNFNDVNAISEIPLISDENCIVAADTCHKTKELISKDLEKTETPHIINIKGHSEITPMTNGKPVDVINSGADEMFMKTKEEPHTANFAEDSGITTLPDNNDVDTIKSHKSKQHLVKSIENKRRTLPGYVNGDTKIKRISKNKYKSALSHHKAVKGVNKVSSNKRCELDNEVVTPTSKEEMSSADIPHKKSNQSPNTDKQEDSLSSLVQPLSIPHSTVKPHSLSNSLWNVISEKCHQSLDKNIELNVAPKMEACSQGQRGTRSRRRRIKPRKYQDIFYYEDEMDVMDVHIRHTKGQQFLWSKTEEGSEPDGYSECPKPIKHEEPNDSLDVPASPESPNHEGNTSWQADHDPASLKCRSRKHKMLRNSPLHSDDHPASLVPSKQQSPTHSPLSNAQTCCSDTDHTTNARLHLPQADRETDSTGVKQESASQLKTNQGSRSAWPRMRRSANARKKASNRHWRTDMGKVKEAISLELRENERPKKASKKSLQLQENDRPKKALKKSLQLQENDRPKKALKKSLQLQESDGPNKAFNQSGKFEENEGSPMFIQRRSSRMVLSRPSYVEDDNSFEYNSDEWDEGEMTAQNNVAPDSSPPPHNINRSPRKMKSEGSSRKSMDTNWKQEIELSPYQQMILKMSLQKLKDQETKKNSFLDNKNAITVKAESMETTPAVALRQKIASPKEAVPSPICGNRKIFNTHVNDDIIQESFKNMMMEFL